MNKELLREIICYSGNSKCLALATVITTGGSSPRKQGAQMLIYPDGQITGTIGGGAVEAEVIVRAVELIKNGGIEKLEYNLSNEEVAKAGGMCGGKVTIFVETIKMGREN